MCTLQYTITPITFPITITPQGDGNIHHASLLLNVPEQSFPITITPQGDGNMAIAANRIASVDLDFR